MLNLKPTIVARLNLFILASALFALLAQCKPKNKNNDQKTEAAKARSIFVAGNVVVKTARNVERKLKLGDFVSATETVKTIGPSVAILQLPDQSVIKILKDSEANFAKILKDKKETEIINKGGKLFARIRKLNSNSSFNVLTPTSVAGVRGTQFLSEYANGISKIHVKEGKVSVKKLSNNKVEEKTETILTTNNIAEITPADIKSKGAIRKRASSAVETVVINKISSGTKPVEDMGTIDQAKLIEISEQKKVQQINSVVQMEKKLSLIKKISPFITLILKDGSKLQGYLITQDAKTMTMQIDIDTVKINKNDIVRRR